MSTQQLPRRDAVRFRKNKKPKGFQVYGLQICLYTDPWLQDPKQRIHCVDNPVLFNRKMNFGRVFGETELRN